MSDNLIEGSTTFLRISPRKLNLVANLTSKMEIPQALAYLDFCPQIRAGKFLRNCLKSVIANAENNFSANIDNLYIKTISVGPAVSRKRVVPRARGRSASVTKRWSNLYICLALRD